MNNSGSNTENLKSMSSDIQNEKDALLAEFLKEKSTDTNTNVSTNDSIDNSISNPADLIQKAKEQSASRVSQETSLENDLNIPASDPLVIKESNPLPLYGKGFIFVPITIAVTILAVILGHIHPMTYGIPSAAWVRYLYIGFGVIILFIGIRLIVDAISVSAINENIIVGKLVTTGVYSKTRNPEYAGIVFCCTALLFFSGNAFMYFLPGAYWLFLTLLMQRTEEVLLEAKFGTAYINYMNNTNRFFPVKKRD